MRYRQTRKWNITRESLKLNWNRALPTCFVDPLILNLDGISMRSRSVLDMTLSNRSRLDLDTCVQMRPDSDKPTERSHHYSSLSTSTEPDETYAAVFNPDRSNPRGVLARPPMPLPNSAQPERDTTTTDKTAATGKGEFRVKIKFFYR